MVQHLNDYSMRISSEKRSVLWMKRLYFSEKKKCQQCYCLINLNNFLQLTSNRNEPRTYSVKDQEVLNDFYCVSKCLYMPTCNPVVSDILSNGSVWCLALNNLTTSCACRRFKCRSMGRETVSILTAPVHFIYHCIALHSGNCTL